MFVYAVGLIIDQGCHNAVRARQWYGSQDTFNNILENKIFYLIKAVRTSSVRCSSVKPELYFGLINFSVETNKNMLHGKL
jgi:hypothetical protein